MFRWLPSSGNGVRCRGRPGLPWRANVCFSFGHKRIDGVSRDGTGAAVQSLTGRPAAAGEQRHIGNWSRLPWKVLGGGLVRGHVTVTGQTVARSIQA